MLIAMSTNASGSDSEYQSYYPYIESVHNGPIKYHGDSTDPNNQGIKYRAVVIFEEAYYSLLIEKYIIGDEGLSNFHSFKRTKIGWDSNSKFGEWKTANTFEATVANQQRLLVIGNDGSATFK